MARVRHMLFCVRGSREGPCCDSMDPIGRVVGADSWQFVEMRRGIVFERLHRE